jgi:uncharacterized membrane protein YfcA
MIGIEWAPLAGALVGLVVGLTGVGGGALMAPILLFGFGFDLATVVATDLLFATITKIVATGFHSKNNYIDWQITKRLWIGSIPATLLVMILAYIGVLFSNPSWVTTALGLLILISGLSLLLDRRIQLYQRSKRILKPEQFKQLQPSATMVGGFVLGGLVSATSIGAGALGAIILKALYPLRMTPKQLVATDTVHAVPVSLIAGIGYLLMGNTNIELLSLLFVGSIPAVVIGSKLLDKAPNQIIRIVLGFILLVTAIKLISS